MADEILVKSGEGNVDVQVGGPGNNWNYLSACASLSGPVVSRGEIELRYCQDPERAGRFKVSTQIRKAADPITADLMTKLGKVDFLEGLDCPFGLRARYTSCGQREDPNNFDPIMLTYCPVQLTEHNYADLVVVTAEDDDEILVTAPWQANSEYRTKKIVPARIGTAATLGDQPINDITYCDEAACGSDCGDTTDGCSTIYGVTALDVSFYANPGLIKGVKNVLTGAIVWTNNPILGLATQAESIVCAGSRVIVSSNGDSEILYNDTPTDQDAWNVVSIGNAPSANPNALYARTAREVWLASNSGFIYKSVDGGAIWTAVHSADITSENINAVWAHDKDLVYAAGDNGVMLRSKNGGETWEDITETSTTSANLLVITVPPDRSREVYIGTNDGMIYRSRNEGGTLAATGDFTTMAFSGQGVGTVDSLVWCGPCGSDVLDILHNDSGPRGRILRDLSGGAGGSDIEIISGYTQVIAAGIDLNAMACCDVNEIIAAGALEDNFPVVIRAS